VIKDTKKIKHEKEYLGSNQRNKSIVFERSLGPKNKKKY
jgi:hypothetical protein